MKKICWAIVLSNIIFFISWSYYIYIYIIKVSNDTFGFPHHSVCDRSIINHCYAIWIIFSPFIISFLIYWKKNNKLYFFFLQMLRMSTDLTLEDNKALWRDWCIVWSCMHPIFWSRTRSKTCLKLIKIYWSDCSMYIE